MSIPPRAIKTRSIQALDPAKSIRLRGDKEHTLSVLETIRAEGADWQGPLTAVDRYRLGLYDYNTNDSVGHVAHRGLPGGGTHAIATGMGRMTLDASVGVLDATDSIFDYSTLYKQGAGLYKDNAVTGYYNFGATKIPANSDATDLAHPASVDALTTFVDIGKRDNRNTVSKESIGDMGVVSTGSTGEFIVTKEGVWRITMMVSMLVNDDNGSLPAAYDFVARLVGTDNVPLVEVKGILSPEIVFNSGSKVRGFSGTSTTLKNFTDANTVFRLYVSTTGGDNQEAQRALYPKVALSFSRIGPAAITPNDDATDIV